MTPTQHINAALEIFARGAIAHLAPKPKGVTLRHWQRRLHSAAYNKGEARRMSFKKYDANTIVIKPR